MTSWSLRPRTYWALRSYSDAVECDRCRQMRLDGRNLREAWPDYDAHVAAEHKPSHYPGQIGSEPHWRDFLHALWAATAEMKRVLKPGGSIFINLGDKYSGYTNGAGKGRNVGGGERGQAVVPDGPPSAPTVWGIPNKSLLLLPEAYRLGCTGALAALGGPDPGLNLIARAVIVQNKLNGLPESVTDRVRRSHEDWVHLVKQPKYYAAVDEIRESYEAKAQRRFSPRMTGKAGATPPGTGMRSGYDETWEEPSQGGNPLGKLPGSVWSLPSEPLVIPEATKQALNLPDHYAAFGSEIVRQIVLAWSPPGICTGCGEGRVPVVDKQRERSNGLDGIRGVNDQSVIPQSGGKGFAAHAETTATILGYACPCAPSTRHPGTGERHRNGDHPSGGNSGVNITAGTRLSDLGSAERVGPWTEYHLTNWQAPPTRPAVVADVFGGTGTVAMVAKTLGRFGVHLDLSMDYCRLAKWRVFDSGHGAKAEARTWAERQVSLL